MLLCNPAKRTVPERVSITTMRIYYHYYEDMLPLSVLHAVAVARDINSDADTLDIYIFLYF